jgi:hypothetical protein
MKLVQIMRKLFVFSLILTFGCSPGSQNVSSFAFAIEVYNPLDVTRKNALVRIPEHAMREMFPDFDTASKSLRVVDREAEIGNEYLKGSFAVVLDSLTAKEKRILNVYYVSESRNYRKRTQAELSHKVGGEWKNREYIGGKFRNVDKLRVPPEHKDHSWFLRYEGPGWESDQVGYRLYLDQRNAIDVFGKRTNDMVLMGVGQDGFDSYHEMQSWGMDVMKVGRSLGLGSLGIWADTSALRVETTDSVLCEVYDGPLTSDVAVKYYGWKTPTDTLDIFSLLSIHAGSRWTLNSNVVADMKKANLCTGIVKDKKGKVFRNPGSDSSFGYIATYGKQSLNNDNLGLAIIFDPMGFVGFREDAFSNVVELKQPDRAGSVPSIDYYFAATWELEPGGIRKEADFIRYVERSAWELANPVRITPRRSK